MGKRRRSYEFDVALSFAGEERLIAKKLAEILKAEGLSVFYDEDHKARLWGKDEREFERIYGPASRFVTPIISKHYVRKPWTRLEFDTALREERNRSLELILPIRADGACLLGLHDGRFYLSLKDNSIEEIAKCLIERCQQPVQSRMPQSQAKSAPKPKVAELSGDLRHALGIIVTSSVPFSLGFYKSFFPDIDWLRHSRTLLKLGLIRESKDHLKPSPTAVTTIRTDEAVRRFYSDKWLARLEELRDHTDIALYLSIRYMSDKRHDDAINLLADVANRGLYGSDNSLYASILIRFTNPKMLKRLNVGARIKLYHALAICATQDDRFADALQWFEKVRTCSVKAKDRYWLGQYFINSGVALDRSGDSSRAASAYEKAIEHGKKHDDPLLVGRALGNLAQLRMSEDEPDAALELMRQSIEWKKRAKDHFGSAISEAQLGAVHANRGDFKAALSHFERAEALFEKRDHTYEQAKSAYNLGNVYADLGQLSKALKAYKRASHLAEADSYLDMKLLATFGIVRVFYKRGQFADIEAEFRALLELPIAAGDTEARLAAYHGMAVAQAMLGNVSEARNNLRKTLKLAGKESNLEWRVKALAASCALSNEAPLQEPSPEQFARLALREEKKGNKLVAHRLWIFAARGFARGGSSVDDADGA